MKLIFLSCIGCCILAKFTAKNTFLHISLLPEQIFIKEIILFSHNKQLCITGKIIFSCTEQISRGYYFATLNSYSSRGKYYFTTQNSYSSKGKYNLATLWPALDSLTCAFFLPRFIFVIMTFNEDFVKKKRKGH